MSLIFNHLGRKIITRGLGSSTVNLVAQCEKISIGINNNVFARKKTYPLSGTFANESGWIWNRTKPQILEEYKAKINSSLGGHIHNLEEGSVTKHWFGSVLSGIELKGIAELQYKTKRKIWTPKFTPGRYSIFHFSKRLFSNSSCCEILTIENTTDTNTYTHAIKNKILDGSIAIVIFKRDASFNNIPIHTYKYDPELSTDLSFRYIVAPSDPPGAEGVTSIEFNSLNALQVGDSPTSNIEELQCKWEHLGLGNKHRGICYTEYFPIVNVSVKTIYQEVIHDWEEKTLAEFELSTPQDRHYIVDKETGKLIFNNNSSIKFSVKTDTVTHIEFHQETAALPDRGFLSFGVETVYFYAKSKYGIYVLDGNKQQRQDSLITGAIGKFIYPGKKLRNMEQIYVSYTRSPRVDYECINNKLFHDSLNIKPYKKINSNGIIELTPQEKHVAKLVLSCDKTLIGNNVFGPLSLQGDVSVLKTTALNTDNKPVGELNTIFFGEEGSFEGDVPAESGILKTTNREGESKTSYYYPYSNDALATYSDVHHEGANSYLICDNLGSGTLLSDIAIFQLLKTDSHSGSLGKEFKVLTKKMINLDTFQLSLEGSLGLDAVEYGKNQLRIGNPRDLDVCIDKEWNVGMCLIKLKHGLGTVGPVPIENVHGDNIITIHARGSVFNKIRFLDIESVHLYKKNELDWSGLGELHPVTPKMKLNRSLNKILYKLSSSTPMYEKVVPDRLVGNKLYFDNVHLPLNSMSDRDNIIAKYKILASKNIKLWSEATDPASGVIVRSNTISLKVDFPNYLRSENGFKFKTLISESSGGLGGANFIAINPTEYVNQINFHILNS
jgi:hypothetical protein